MSGEESVIAAATPAVSVPQVAGGRLYPDLWPYEARTGWRPWPAVAIVVLIMAVSLAIGFGLSLGLGFGRARDLGSKSNAAALMAMLVAQVCMVAGALIAAQLRGGGIISALALKAPVGGFGSYVRGFALLALAVGAFTVLTNVVLGQDAGQDLAEFSGLFRGPWWLLALFVVGVGAPLSEELLFRGFLQTALVPTRLGYWGATLVTTSIWAALHAGYSVAGLIEVFLIGLVFAWILRRTGSLRVTIVCHAVYNSALALMVAFVPAEILGF